ncbi:unnamed protein product [Agarophyton chilense]
MAPAAESSGQPLQEALQSKDLSPLSLEEIRKAARLSRDHLSDNVRFSAITLAETCVARAAVVIAIVPPDATAYKLHVELASSEVKELPIARGAQPVLTPDDCNLAETIVKRDARVRDLISKRYGMYDIDSLVCDPWSVHIAGEYEPLHFRKDGQPARLVQTFLYKRVHPVDNHYAHPIDILPVVDLNLKTVVTVEGVQRSPPLLPSAAVNYHPDLLKDNDYLPSQFRKTLRPLQVVQPDGPSFTVRDNNVDWEKWSFSVGFNYREGLVLHDIQFDNRSVVKRASLVEMAVPYADTHPPFERKCAFDVGDYGLGYCANSLDLGCDCLGAIHYFDAVLSDSRGEPYVIKKAICMHEEDVGLLYKHVEYRTGHSESRRARRLVISFIATVVNYEYLFYWYLHHDGSISHEIKLSGELSTNLLSEGENEPTAGVIVAPGVNAQIHQHMFCARLEMAVDGARNSVEEVNLVAAEAGEHNSFGNAFRVESSLLRTEQEAQRNAVAARTWRIFNPHKENYISGKKIAYKLVPYTFGSFQPHLLTTDESAVSKRGWFAKKSLWVTPYEEGENYPAGEFPTQSAGGDGLPLWTTKNRSIVDERIVVWHSFGVAHVPRTEDFPVMPCESTGFTLKPDCFFLGNPGIDLPPQVDGASWCKPLSKFGLVAGSLSTLRADGEKDPAQRVFGVLAIRPTTSLEFGHERRAPEFGCQTSSASRLAHVAIDMWPKHAVFWRGWSFVEEQSSSRQMHKCSRSRLYVPLVPYNLLGSNHHSLALNVPEPLPTMHDWKQRMHNSTSAMIVAISQIHYSSSSAQNPALISNLVNSMTDIIETQEIVNSKMQEQLSAHRKWRLATEQRLANLEQRLAECGERKKSSPSPVHAFEQSASFQVTFSPVGGKRRRAADQSLLHVEQCASSNHSPVRTRKPTRGGTADRDEPHAVQNPLPVPSRRPRHQSISQRTCVFETNTLIGKREAAPQHNFEEQLQGEKTTSPAQQVKPPFTVAKILRERAEREKEKRYKAELQPFPCERCCKLKREELEKKHGFVKQDVYQRYIERRGACYHFVHQDEPLPEDYPRSQLSFDETATASPKS